MDPSPGEKCVMSPSRCDVTAEQVELETRAWLDTVIIGLNLCPFAKAALPGTKIVVTGYDGTRVTRRRKKNCVFTKSHHRKSADHVSRFVASNNTRATRQDVRRIYGTFVQNRRNRRNRDGPESRLANFP